jgi:hypothetical protein
MATRDDPRAHGRMVADTIGRRSTQPTPPILVVDDKTPQR